MLEQRGLGHNATGAAGMKHFRPGGGEVDKYVAEITHPAIVSLALKVTRLRNGHNPGHDSNSPHTCHRALAKRKAQRR